MQLCRRDCVRQNQSVLMCTRHASSDDEAHDGTFAFRVGQWPLSVTLEAPPSNPALALSKIDVGISLIGAGIAVQRVSDAKGRLEVASFPEGTFALECVAVAGARYYYGDATLAHSAPGPVAVLQVFDVAQYHGDRPWR